MACLVQVRPPMPPAHLFLVDVSHQAVSTGLTAAACAAIAAVLDDLQGTFCAHLPGSKIGRSPGKHMLASQPDSDNPDGLPPQTRGMHAAAEGNPCNSAQRWSRKASGFGPCAGGERVRVGLATFDSAVHFYGLRSGLAAPAMLVVPDAERPFCPEPASLVVPLQASRALVRPPRGFRSFPALLGAGRRAVLWLGACFDLGWQCRRLVR